MNKLKANRELIEVIQERNSLVLPLKPQLLRSILSDNGGIKGLFTGLKGTGMGETESLFCIVMPCEMHDFDFSMMPAS